MLLSIIMPNCLEKKHSGMTGSMVNELCTTRDPGGKMSHIDPKEWIFKINLADLKKQTKKNKDKRNRKAVLIHIVGIPELALNQKDYLFH